jgi:hypothetical protein
VDLDEVLYVGDDTEGDLDSNTIQSRRFNHFKTADVWTSEVGPTLGRIGGFGWNLVWRDGIEYYLDYVLFNLVASAIPQWQTFKLLRWVLLLNRLADLDEIVYGGDEVEDDLDSILHNPVP